MKEISQLSQLPEVLLAGFGLLVAVWFGLEAVSPILLIPVSITVLAGVHLIAPRGRITQLGLAVAYVVGALVAGFLVLGFMIPGGAPAEYEAYARVATPLLGLYAVSVIALVLKLR